MKGESCKINSTSMRQFFEVIDKVGLKDIPLIEGCFYMD